MISRAMNEITDEYGSEGNSVGAGNVGENYVVYLEVDDATVGD